MLANLLQRLMSISDVRLLRSRKLSRVKREKCQARPRSAVDSVSDKGQMSRVRYPFRPYTFVSLSADLRRVVVSYWRQYVYLILVNRLGGLPRKVVRLTDGPDMTIAVYRARKTTIQ